MEKHIMLGYLLDCYGALLTERQRSLITQSVDEDCSLSEIAEREGISRQGVRDAINSASRQLEEYEAKLGMLKRNMALMEGLTELKNSLSTADTEALYKLADRLMEICEDGI